MLTLCHALSESWVFLVRNLQMFTASRFSDLELDSALVAELQGLCPPLRPRHLYTCDGQ